MALPAHVAQRLTEGHHRALSKALSGPALSGLRGLSLGLLKPVLPKQVADELIAAGFARQGFGGVMLTDAGIIRAMQEGG